MGKISNYANVLKSKLTDLFVVYQRNDGELETKNATLEQLGDAICGEQVHATLETDDKTIIGGINENKDKVGDLSQLTTTDKSSLVGAVNELAPTAYTQATRASTLSSGALGYVKIGKVVIANLNYTTNTSNVSTHDTVLYSDLPPAISNIYLNFVDEVGNVTRVRVGTDGKMHLHYSTITANKEINGSFVYLSA